LKIAEWRVAIDAMTIGHWRSTDCRLASGFGDRPSTRQSTIDPQSTTVIPSIDPRTLVIPSIDPRALVIPSIDPRTLVIPSIDPRALVIPSIDPRALANPSIGNRQSPIGN
jgi:hypothetical protein